MIQRCFQLYSTSPKTYQQLKDSGILTSQDSRTLRDYTNNCYKSGLRFDPSFIDLVRKDFLERWDPKDSDSWLSLIHEVSLRKDLVFDDTGKLIGFVDLGATQNQIDEFEGSLSSEGSLTIPEVAIHMFVSMAVSLFSNCKMPVAFLPANTI